MLVPQGAGTHPQQMNSGLVKPKVLDRSPLDLFSNLKWSLAVLLAF